MHADALRRACFGLAAQTGHKTLGGLIEAYPALVATRTLHASPQVEKICSLRSNRDAWAVCAMGIWCALVKPVKSAASQVFMASVLHERTCVACNRRRGRRHLEVTDATLYTMGSHVAVRTGVWTCKCKQVVRYDGVDSAIFAYSPNTVFTRIYLDIVLHIALTSRSSLTAATAAVAFCLHVTAGLPLQAHGHTRQMLNLATAAFMETLVVQASTYACEGCLAESGPMKYLTMIADGQVLGVFREKARPFMRFALDNPVVDLKLKNGCAVKSSLLRSAIRKRCTTHIFKPSSLKTREMKALDSLSLTSDRAGAARVCDDSSVGQSSAEEAEWAAGYIFSSLFARQARAGEADDNSAGEPTRDSSAASGEAPDPPAGESSKLANPDGTEQNGAAAARGCRASGANVSVRIKGAVGGEDGNRLLLCERWRVVQRICPLSWQSLSLASSRAVTRTVYRLSPSLSLRASRTANGRS